MFLSKVYICALVEIKKIVGKKSKVFLIFLVNDPENFGRDCQNLQGVSECANSKEPIFNFRDPNQISKTLSKKLVKNNHCRIQRRPFYRSLFRHNGKC